MTEQVSDYNKALSKISGRLPVRRSTDSAFIDNTNDLMHALLDVRPGSSVMFTPVEVEKGSGRMLIRGGSESVNYSPKE